MKILKAKILALPEEYDSDTLQAVQDCLDAFEETRVAKNKEIRVLKERMEEEKKRAVYEAEKAIYAKYTDIMSKQLRKNDLEAKPLPVVIVPKPRVEQPSLVMKSLDVAYSLSPDDDVVLCYGSVSPDY